MKTASTLLQALALLACFSAQALSGGTFTMPGVRRAMQTMDSFSMPAAASASPSSMGTDGA